MSESTSKPRLLLIDGHSAAYRAFFALPVDNFATSSGQPTNAVYGFTSMLINLLRDESPTHIGVAFDVSRKTFRSERYAEYKAQRAASPEEFKGQVSLIKEVLDALKIVHIELDGFEADDLIATLTKKAEIQGFDVLICTGDRDALQLVDENVTVLYPRKGVSDLARMTPTVVEEKYGVTPGRYPELAALVGESSDNLPGVPGVGPKTAAKWLSQFDGLDNLVLHADEVPGKVGDSFRSHLDDVVRNRQLNALVDDLALDVEPQDLVRREWDQEAVHQIFDALEFRVLRERLWGALPNGDDAVTSVSGFEVNGVRLSPGEVTTWLRDHASIGVTGIDAMGRWESGVGDLSSLSLASGDGFAAFIDVSTLSPDDDAALATWLSDESYSKVMHAAKGPIRACWQRGWNLVGTICDTELAAYLLRPDQRSYSLDDLCVRYLGRELRMDTDDSEQLMLDFAEEEHTDEVVNASMVRARAIVDLAEKLSDELASLRQAELLRDVELPLQRTLARMEYTGIAVDLDVLEGLRSDFDAKVIQAEHAAYEVLGRQINLGSPKQLQGVLFDELQMPKTRRTKSGYTTDAEALSGLYARTEHPFLAHLLAHRDAIKLRQTVEGLLKAVADDGRIHTTYAQTIAATGRLSSTDPNLQNIPIRTDEGRRIREAFIVGVGYETLLTADYSQIEMRVMAHASNDQGVIDAFRSGADFHTMTAAKVFGIVPEAITPAQRAKVKQMNFGLAYGLSAFGLSNQLGISVGEARELMDDYFEIFGGVREYLTGVVAQARKSGYTETLLGRRRYLPDLNSSNKQRREMAERMALNAPIQGTAADIIKIAMIGVERAIDKMGMSSRMLLQVHDELLLEVGKGEKATVEELVRKEMGEAMRLAVPLDVSVGVGRSWYDAAH